MNIYFCNVFDKLMNVDGAKNTRQTFINWRNNVNNLVWCKAWMLTCRMKEKECAYPLLMIKYLRGKNGAQVRLYHWLLGRASWRLRRLQMANIECTIANHGFYYKPHLIKAHR